MSARSARAAAGRRSAFFARSRDPVRGQKRSARRRNHGSEDGERSAPASNASRRAALFSGAGLSLARWLRAQWGGKGGVAQAAV